MSAYPMITVGGAAGLYRNTGTQGTPVWSEVVIVRDVTPQNGWDFPEGSTRATPLKLYAKAQVDNPIQVVMRADILDAEYQAWVAAHWSRIAVFDLLVLNAKRTVVGASGWRGPYLVSMTEEAQVIDGVIYSTFELRPTYDTESDIPVTAGANRDHPVFAEVLTANNAAVLVYTAPDWTA